MAAKQKWRDFSERRRRLILVAAVAEAGLKMAMLIDIKRRPADQIRGSKWMWRALAFINGVGRPLALGQRNYRLSAPGRGESPTVGVASSLNGDILWVAAGGNPMVTRVQKWGNSQGLRLSKELLSDAEIDVGDVVDVAVHEGSIVVTPVRRVRGALDLEQLVTAIPRDYNPGEADWGPLAGGEVW